MKCLSDRAFQLVKDEVNRHYIPVSDGRTQPAQNIERSILLARLETLHQRNGKPLTHAQLWEEVCDILPEFDRKVLMRAGRRPINASTACTSLGLSTASIGTAVILLANPSSEGTRQVSEFFSFFEKTDTIEVSAKLQTSQNHTSIIETAKAFGWQAALKGQNPPHTVQHWGEAAALWELAIGLLDQVPRYDESYAIAQNKKAEYAGYLQQVQARALSAQNDVIAATPSPQFTRTNPTKAKSVASNQPPLTEVAQEVAQIEIASDSVRQSPQEDLLVTAKHYGWQAAIASQNAPHPVEKWVDISRLWQIALKNLNKVEPQHPSYAEAQHTKTQYEKNLAAIRQRYRTEQDANQRVQSLQAALIELETTQPNDIKRSQMQSIVHRLGTISANTVAYGQAQQLIDRTNTQIQLLPSVPSNQIAISTESSN